MPALEDRLHLQVRNRIIKLLANPCAGSRIFRFNHPRARYYSNCHGTVVYVLALPHSRKKQTHPGIVETCSMERILQKHCVPSARFGIGSIICFYHNSSEEDDEVLVHTAVAVGSEGDIFHQSGAGGVFEISTIETKLRTYPGANVRSFSRRN